MKVDHPVWKLRSNGYDQISKSRQLIAKIIGLNDKEYRLWDLFCSLTMYKPHHPEVNNIVRITDLEASHILGKGWSAPTVCRTRKRLEALMVIEIVEMSTYRLLVPMTKEVPSTLKDDVTKMQDEIANMKARPSNLQACPEEYLNPSNNSNKSNNMNRSMTTTTKSRSEEEYEEILHEGDFPGLGSDDMRFIDNQDFIETNPVV